MLSAAGQMLGFDSTDLLQRRSEEIEEIKKKRQQQAQLAGYSPAGSLLAGSGILGL